VLKARNRARVRRSEAQASHDHRRTRYVLLLTVSSHHILRASSPSLTVLNLHIVINMRSSFGGRAPGSGLRTRLAPGTLSLLSCLHGLDFFHPSLALWNLILCLHVFFFAFVACSRLLVVPRCLTVLLPLCCSCSLSSILSGHVPSGTFFVLLCSEASHGQFCNRRLCCTTTIRIQSSTDVCPGSAPTSAQR
jgi:hypothetical protein